MDKRTRERLSLLEVEARLARRRSHVEFMRRLRAELVQAVVEVKR